MLQLVAIKLERFVIMEDDYVPSFDEVDQDDDEEVLRIMERMVWVPASVVDQQS